MYNAWLCYSLPLWILCNRLLLRWNVVVYFKGFSINKYLPSWADESAYQQLLCYQLSSFQLISRHGLELLEKSVKVGSSKVCKTWLGSDGKSILLLHCWFLFWLVFQWEYFSIFCYLYFLSCISFLRERGGEGMAVLLGHKGCLLCPCCHGCPIQINGKAPIGYRKATISWQYCDLCCTSVYLTPEDGKKHSQGVSKVPITVAVLCPSSQQSPLLSLLIGSSSWSKSSATPRASSSGPCVPALFTFLKSCPLASQAIFGQNKIALSALAKINESKRFLTEKNDQGNPFRPWGL